jgi:hypothetical protein
LRSRTKCRRYPRKYPYPAYDVDHSGLVKLRTLEFFVLNEGWHTPEGFRSDASLDKWEDIFPYSKAVQMRFLRYTRLGLLERKKVSRNYEYEITMRGEQRWIHMSRRRGLLEPEKAKNLEEKNLVSMRRERALELLKKHKMIVEEKLRSPAK